MKATQQLKDEHQGVNLGLDILEEIARRLERKEKVNPDHLSQLLEFLQVFVDKCHHTKEEELLFPAMERAGIPKEGGPIGMMLLDHDEGRGYIKGLKEAIAEYQNGDEEASSKISENALHYIDLLREHIGKEDNILYVIADEVISAEKQDELLAAFDRVETEKVGAGKHEQFHKMLSELKGVYLSS